MDSNWKNDLERRMDRIEEALSRINDKLERFAKVSKRFFETIDQDLEAQNRARGNHGITCMRK